MMKLLHHHCHGQLQVRFLHIKEYSPFAYIEGETLPRTIHCCLPAAPAVLGFILVTLVAPTTTACMPSASSCTTELKSSLHGNNDKQPSMAS
jgi:hypothetical protein